MAERHVSIRSVFLAWEHLRVVYNLVLLLVTFASWTIGKNALSFLGLLSVGVKGAIVANILFFAGPALDGYVQWLGWRQPLFRRFLFGAGLVFASFLTLTSILRFGPLAGFGGD